jgi:hypothetical protein
MRPYQEYLSKLIKEFDEIKFTHMGRDKNWFAPLNIDVKNSSAYYYSVEEEVDGNPWYHDIKQFIQYQEYPREASSIDMKPMKVSPILLPR